ncbi:MAG: hypothetical protein IK023_03490, partial [Bacteroidaceae bacterium]|nr:hypothetical protein [Bacteroidaceae bacterium]
MKTIISKKRTFYITFLVVVAILFIAKKTSILKTETGEQKIEKSEAQTNDSLKLDLDIMVNGQCSMFNVQWLKLFRPHPIYGVSNYDTAFPDVNDEQLPYAQRHGI